MKVIILIAIFLINLAICGWSVDAILSWFTKDIPFVADAAIGLFIGEFSVPIAIIGEVLRFFGVF